MYLRHLVFTSLSLLGDSSWKLILFKSFFAYIERWHYCCSKKWKTLQSWSVELMPNQSVQLYAYVVTAGTEQVPCVMIKYCQYAHFNAENHCVCFYRSGRGSPISTGVDLHIQYRGSPPYTMVMCSHVGLSSRLPVHTPYPAQLTSNILNLNLFL